jgi:hypothetical protein
MTNKTSTIVQHCCVYGDLRTVVRRWEVKQLGGTTPNEVIILFTRPRERNDHHFTISPDNIRWTTIEDEDGTMLYDSRVDVPCDMDIWQANYDRHHANYETV